MMVKIVYKNKKLEVVNVEQYKLEDYCNALSQQTLSLLFQIDDLLAKKTSYDEIKHYIFDLSGNIRRLPNNLLEEDKSKDKSFFDIFRKGG